MCRSDPVDRPAVTECLDTRDRTGLVSALCIAWAALGWHIFPTWRLNTADSCCGVWDSSPGLSTDEHVAEASLESGCSQHSQTSEMLLALLPFPLFSHLSVPGITFPPPPLSVTGGSPGTSLVLLGTCWYWLPGRSKPAPANPMPA